MPGPRGDDNGVQARWPAPIIGSTPRCGPTPGWSVRNVSIP